MRSLVFGALATGILLSAAGCRCSGDSEGDEVPVPGLASALPAGVASTVLAEVNGRPLTVAEYAAALGRLDPMERLRYQAPERRQELLQELIDLELLAAEAERRGLANQPETQRRIRQALRDELRADLRRQVAAQEPTKGDLRRYFDEHPAEFQEPERRRVSVIELSSRVDAERVLGEARKGGEEAWPLLVKKHSLRQGELADLPPKLFGDWGIVTREALAPSEKEIPDPVRAAVFTIAELGQLASGVVEAGRRFYVVRMTGKSEARKRTFEESEHSIQRILTRQRLEAAERSLEAELRTRYPVTIDEAALAAVPAPSASVQP